MTAPNQPAPPGAFVLGTGFGQGITEPWVRGLWKPPTPTLETALDALEAQLLKMPLEALEVFKPIIPDWIEDDFASVAAAVTKVMSVLVAPIKFLSELDWEQFVTDLRDAISQTYTGDNPALQDINNLFIFFSGAMGALFNAVNGIDLEIDGGILVAITDADNAVKLWIRESLTGITGATPTQLDDWLVSLLTGESDLDAGKLVNLEDIGDIAKEKITGLVSQLSDIEDDVANALADSAQALRDELTGIVNATPTDVDDWVLGLLTGSSSLDATKLINTIADARIPTLSQSKISGLVSDLAGKLTPSSSLNAANLVGSVAAALITGTLGTGNIPTLPQSKITDLETTFSQFADLLDDIDVASPINDAVANFKALVGKYFFDGSSNNVVSKGSIAATSGIAPLDAGQRVPWDNLPAALSTFSANVSWIRFELGADKTVGTSSETKITGLTQQGSATATITSDEFELPFPGYWDIEICGAWDSNTTNTRSIGLKRSSTVLGADATTASEHGFYGPRNNLTLRVPVYSGDKLALYGWQNSGANRGLLAAGTYILCTYVGESSTTPNVTFDQVGGGDSGNKSSFSWNQSFGANADTATFSIAAARLAAAPQTPTITIGGVSVPVLSGPTEYGTYFSWRFGHTFAAIKLPSSVKGTTKAVSVTFPSSAACSMCSASFNNVGSIGSPVASTGTGSPTLLVPSNSSSMVSMGFAGMDVNFSSYNQTADYTATFSATTRLPQVFGHAVGGSLFTATNSSKWSGKGVELHP